LKSIRQKSEKELIKNNKDASYPSYEDLYSESNEFKDQLIFTIKNSDGLVVKKVFKSPKMGVQRFQWDLRYEEKVPISFAKSNFYNPFAGVSEGTLVNPGKYSIELDLFNGSEFKKLSNPVFFNVVALNNTSMPALDRSEKVTFQRKVSSLEGEMLSAAKMLGDASNKIKYFKEAIKLVEAPYDELSKLIFNTEFKIKSINTRFYGNSLKSKLDIQEVPTAYGRLMSILYEQKYSTSSPTKTHLESFEIAKEEFTPIFNKIKNILEVDIKEIEDKLKIIKAPYTPGRLKPNN
jgi:hypothetical protein